MDRPEFDKVLESYYKEHRNHLIKAYIGRSGSFHNAEDVVQEAVVRAITYHKTYEPNLSTFDAWFKRILDNACRDFTKDARSRGMSVEINDDDLYSFNPNPYFTLHLNDIRKDVDQLSSDAKHIVSLNLFDQLTAPDIVRVTDKSLGAVKMTIHRFKEQLRYKYGESLYG